MDQAEQWRLNKQLLKAAGDGQKEMVKALLEAGAEVNARDNDGWTALHVAAGRGRTEVVKALLEAGADVNATDGGGWTARHWAAGYGRMPGAWAAGSDSDQEEVRKLLQEHERKNNPVCKAWRRLADWDKSPILNALNSWRGRQQPQAPQLPALFDPEQTDVCDFLEQLDSMGCDELDRQLAAAARYRRRDTHPVVRALNSWRGARPQAIPQPKSPGP